MFNLARTTECIFTINNKYLTLFSTFYFQVSDFGKVFLAKFIQLLIFSKSTNLCIDEMKCANVNFRYFIRVICCSFIIHMGYIKSLEQQMLFISEGFLPSLNFVCPSANSGYKGMFISLVDVLQITVVIY